MQFCEQLTPREFSGAAPVVGGSGAGQLPVSRNLAEYLHEDLAQTLCAVKFHLETLGQHQLQRGALEPSIVALQDVIRQVRALAVEMRPVAAGAGSRTGNAGNDAPRLRRVRARASAVMHGSAVVAALAG